MCEAKDQLYSEVFNERLCIWLVAISYLNSLQANSKVHISAGIESCNKQYWHLTGITAG